MRMDRWDKPGDGAPCRLTAKRDSVAPEDDARQNPPPDVAS